MDKKISEQYEVEPLLKKTTERLTLFPIHYADIYKEFKNHQSVLWVAEELNYEKDIDSWNKLDDNQRYFIEHILAFFAGADGIVLENLMGNFSKEVQIAEARQFYGIQSYIECVHSETYSLLIDTYIKDKTRKEELFNAIETIPCIKQKAEWAMKWMDPNTQLFSSRLIAFVVVEGLFFSGAFCAIFWLKKMNLMTNALCKSNEFIARDEGLHARFGVLLYKYIKNKVPESEVHSIFRSAVEIETEFIIDSLPCRLIGMSDELMIQYIKYIADYWLVKLGYSKIYNVKNPFDFMEMMSMDGKTNFFEQSVTEYNLAHLTSSESSREFNNKLDDF